MALGTHLNLADTFPRDAQLRTDLVQRAAAAIRDTVAQPENSGLAFGKLRKKQPDFLNGLVLAHSVHRIGADVIRQKLGKSISATEVIEWLTERFVLIDRDGTINVEKHYLSDPDQLELYPGIGPALKRLQDAGFGLAVLESEDAWG